MRRPSRQSGERGEAIAFVLFFPQPDQTAAVFFEIFLDAAHEQHDKANGEGKGDPHALEMEIQAAHRRAGGHGVDAHRPGLAKRPEAAQREKRRIGGHGGGGQAPGPCRPHEHSAQGDVHKIEKGERVHWPAGVV